MRSSVRLVLALCLSVLSIGPARAQGLFVEASAGARAAVAVDTGPDEAIPGTVKRSRLVGLDAGYLDARRPGARAAGGPSAGTLAAVPPIVLNLFPDIPPVTMTVTAEEIRADGRLVWRGAPEGGNGFIALVVNGSQVTGTIQAGGQTIEIRPSAFDLHRIVEIDASRFPAEARPMQPPVPPSPPANPGLQAPQSSPYRASADGNTTINVLAVYSSRSESASSDIVSEIHLAVATSNTVYANSGIAITLNLVGAQLMSDYSETSRSYVNILNDLTGTSDGRMDSVHALRTSLGADLVVYFTERSEYCGLAWLYNRYPQYGFSVVTRSCATGNLTFPHELGHNMGAEHDRYVVSGASSTAYNYGYVDTTARIRTVMAYNDRCAASGFNCTRIPYFSSPYLTYAGTAIGASPYSTTGAYNARTLSENASGIAGFRSGTIASIAPASGWWWNASEAGRGYSIEIANGRLFFAVYTYAADGTALWYISTGSMTNSTTYSGALQQFSGGQTLDGTYRAATSLGSVGTVQIYFYAANSGYVAFPDGSGASITRFDFTTNGSVGGTLSGYPQTGWWWNASEGGRGFFIEAQNTAMFVSFRGFK
ncbi:MAG: hypothetical protein FJX60_23185 [Alphaproteobacteria bacterium]|nr:hypothetical protein [Alphaproteobacteria bacterium]